MARPRTPTALLEVRGAFGKNPKRKRAGEPVAEGEAVKPRFVKGTAARIWREYAPLIAAMGLLKAVDSFNFGVCCCLAAEFDNDHKRMPANRIAQMWQVGERFGLDAGARAKLAVTAEQKSEDPADKYLNHAFGSRNSLRQ
jgi:phage terminase small subunit